MTDLGDELRQLLIEQAAAESDADREYEARRQEVDQFLDTALLPAYTELSAAFHSVGPQRQARFGRDLDRANPEAELTIHGPQKDGIEFQYVIEVAYGPRKIALLKQISDVERRRETWGYAKHRAARFTDFDGDATPITAISKEQIIADFMHDYREYLVSIRR